MTNCNPPITPVTIVQGSDATFSVRLIKSETKDPYDLTSLVSCSTQFRNADGITFLTLNLASGITVASPPTIGKLVFTIPAAQTALLNPGINSFQMTILVGSTTSVVQFTTALNVLTSVFS